VNIYEAINNAMNEIGAIGKTSKNAQQGFMFRGIDAVMNAIQPALINNKIFIVPEVLEQTREERTTAKGGLLIYSICKIKYTFYAEDGSSISATVIGEGMDSGDKATNKALSIGFKYACFQVFCIPTEEMKDPDAECHEVAPKPVDGKISEADVKDLVKQANERGISIEAICTLYKVKSFKDFTEKQMANLVMNWDKVKERLNADKGETK
jgi:hypothetical protein